MAAYDTPSFSAAFSGGPIEAGPVLDGAALPADFPLLLAAAPLKPSLS